MNPDTPRLIFYHLPRTAGSALMYDVLFPNFSWWRRCHVNYDGQMDVRHRGRDPRSWSEWRRKRIQLLAGHMPFGFAQHFPGASEYFTFLRNPISRAISDYHFCRKNPDNPAFAAANKLPLKQFVERNYSFVRNGQARWLSNAAYGAKFADDEAMLEAAIRNLDQIAFVGITEQFELSVERLSHRYGLAAHSGDRPNKNDFTPRSHQVSEEDSSVLRRYNALDTAIYEYGLKRFAAQEVAQAVIG